MGLFSRTTPMQEAQAALAEAEVKLKIKLLESNVLQLDNFVDPRDAFLDDRGIPWEVIGSDGSGVDVSTEDAIIQPKDDSDLRTMRVRSRILVARNEFAGAALENLVDYTVGSGMSYTVQARKGFDVDESVVDAIQQEVENFLDASRFTDIERECVRRSHRDGEFFLRRFEAPVAVDGNRDAVQLRFIEPADVRKPKGSTDHGDHFGIRTQPGDIETPVEYWIDSEAEWIPAEEV
ncbi:MAG: phage portal protein, partial [Dehalococcoidia bacterium]